MLKYPVFSHSPGDDNLFFRGKRRLRMSKIILVFMAWILVLAAGCATTTNVTRQLQQDETLPEYSLSITERSVWEAVHSARLHSLPEGKLSALEVCTQFNTSNKRAEDYLHLRPLNPGEERDVPGVPELLAGGPFMALVMEGPAWRRWLVTIFVTENKLAVGVKTLP
ncbi:MAG: hypothetical protein WC070_03085 [Candidatus Magasanikbacteria bacterium]